MITLIALPVVCSVATGAAALLWCRAVVPMALTSIAVAAAWAVFA